MKVAVDLRDLVCVEEAAITGNFTHAAKDLHVDTATVSRRIGRLEDDLGISLFERVSRGVRLTNSGKTILAHIRRVLLEIDAIRQVGVGNGSGMAGQVRLAAHSPPVGEPMRSLLSEWRTRHPYVGLEARELSSRDIQSALRDGNLDVAIIAGYELWSGVHSVPLYREHLLAALPIDHQLADEQTVGWQSLADQTVILREWENGQSERDFYASLIGRATTFQVHAGNEQWAMALVAAGFGVALTTRSQSEVLFPGVVYRPIRDENAWIEVHLAWRPEADEPAVGRFVAFMRDQARSRHLF